MKRILLLLVLIDSIIFGFMLKKEEQPVSEVQTAVQHTPPSAAEVSEAYVQPYHYTLLSPQEMEAYDAIVQGLSAFHTRIDLPLISDSSFIKASTAVKMDHPELWFAGSPTYYMRGRLVLYAEYDIPEDAEVTAKRIDELSDQVINEMPEGLDEYGKAMYIYRWLCENVIYDDTDIAASQDVRSVFLEHTSVCGGIADAYTLLANKAGLNCITVCGSAMNEGERVNHAWNEVRINDSWVWIDATWGNQDGWVNLLEFGMDDEEALLYRTISTTAGADSLPEGTFTYPSAHDRQYGWCAQNGCLFETYDRDTVTSYIMEQPDDAYIYLQFADNEAYSQAHADLYEKTDGENAYFHTIVHQKYGAYKPWYFTDIPEKNAMIFVIQ